MTASVGPSLQARRKHQLFDNGSNYLSYVPAAPSSDDVDLSQAFKVDDRIRGLKNKGTKRSWTAPLRPQSTSVEVSNQGRSALPLPALQQSGLNNAAKRRRRELEFKTPVRQETRPRDILDIISQPSQSLGSQNVWKPNPSSQTRGMTSQTSVPRGMTSQTSVPRGMTSQTIVPRGSLPRSTPTSLSGRDDPRFLSAVDSLRRGGKRPTLPGEMNSSQATISFDDSTQDSLLDVAELERSPVQRPPLLIPGRTPNNTHAMNRELRPVEEIPSKYRSVFKFPYFNLVQSKVFDDVFNSDKSLIMCAPTGSGKTAVFELALVRLLADLESSGNPLQFKAVYMAPMKALCSERYDDWKEKFEPLGVRCLELTGDTEMDELSGLHNINIIITTPEKWDIMTRKWRDNRSLINKLQLFMVDEIHNLNDDNRGATMEVVISRMKTVDAACRRQDGTRGIKFVAVSATIPNVEDLAEWLGREKEKAAYYNLDESYRPVKLEKIVLGFPCGDYNKGFKFDYSLNYRVSSVIRNFSRQKPTLVFVSTRKGTQQAASILGKDAKFILDANHKERLRKSTGIVKEGKLRELMMIGIGYHHAGLEKSDRKLVEEVFIRGDLPVLFATSTLAMGVNLPAHLVIVKCTQYYNMGVYQEYPESQILQMIGRAGRPQFDTSATAVIMTRNTTKTKYEQLLNGTEVIESSLHQHLIEHVNAEIVLRTIYDVNVALEWIRCTFLYIRCMKNPKHYALPTGLSKERVEEYLQTLCLESVKKLNSVRLIDMDEEGIVIKPTELGRNMARFCITFDTMTTFMNVKGIESVSSLIEIISGCDQFDITLRTNEKRTLNALNESKQSIAIRYPMKGKKIKTSDMKINCLIQAQLGCLKVEDFSLSQDIMRIFRVGVRLLRCLVEVTWMKNQFETLLSAVFLAKCFSAKLWENSKFVSRQLEGIGLMLSNALVNAGLTTFQSLEDTNPREIELTANKKPPFGDNIRSLVIGLPKYRLDITQTGRTTAQTCEIQISVSLANGDSVMMFRTAGKEHRCCLLIGDSDNNVICQARIKDEDLLQNDWTRKVNVKRGEKDDSLRVYYISQDWVGIDISTSFSPQYSSPRPRPIAPVKPFEVEKQDPGHNRQNGSKAPRPCNHRCSNKQTCAHDCCKNGLQQRPRQTSNSRPIGKKPQLEDDDCKIARVQEFIQRRMTPNPGNNMSKMNTTLNEESNLSSRFSYRPAPQLVRQSQEKPPPPPPPSSSVFDNPFDDSPSEDNDTATNEYRSNTIENGRSCEYDEYARRFETKRNSGYDRGDSRSGEIEKRSYANGKKQETSLTYGDFDCAFEDSPPMDFEMNSPDHVGVVDRSHDDDLWKGPEIMMDDSSDLPDLVGDSYTTDQVIVDDSIEWSDGEFDKTNYNGCMNYDQTTYRNADDDDVIDCNHVTDDVMKKLTESEFDDGVDYSRVDDVLPVMTSRERRRVTTLNESGYSSYSDPGAVSALDRYSGHLVDPDEFAQTSPTDELLSKVPLPGEYERPQYGNQGNDSLDDFDIPDDELAAIFQEDMSNAPSWKTSTPKSTKNSNYHQPGPRFTFSKTSDSLQKPSQKSDNSVKSQRMGKTVSQGCDVTTNQSTDRSAYVQQRSGTARKLFTPSAGKFGDDSLEVCEDNDQESFTNKTVRGRGYGRDEVHPGTKFQNTDEPPFTSSPTRSVSHGFQNNRITPVQKPRMLGAPNSRKKVSFNETLEYEPETLHPDFKSARSLMSSYEQKFRYPDQFSWKGTDAEFQELEIPEPVDESDHDQSSYFEAPSVKQNSVSKNLVQQTIPSRYYTSRENESDRPVPSIEPEEPEDAHDSESMKVIETNESRFSQERQISSFAWRDSGVRCLKPSPPCGRNGFDRPVAQHPNTRAVSKSSRNFGRPAVNTGTTSDNRYVNRPAATVSRVMNETRQFKVDPRGESSVYGINPGPSVVPLRVPVPANDYSLRRPETVVNWVKSVLELTGNLKPFNDSLLDTAWEDCTKWETELLRGEEVDRVTENTNYTDAVRTDECLLEESDSCGVGSTDLSAPVDLCASNDTNNDTEDCRNDHGRPDGPESVHPAIVAPVTFVVTDRGTVIGTATSCSDVNDDVTHRGTFGGTATSCSDVTVDGSGEPSEVATTSSSEPGLEQPRSTRDDVINMSTDVSGQIAVNAAVTSASVDSVTSPLTENRDQAVDNDVITLGDVTKDTAGDVVMTTGESLPETERVPPEQRVEPMWRGRELDQFDDIINKIFNISD